jgi:hypothetical protein
MDKIYKIDKDFFIKDTYIKYCKWLHKQIEIELEQRDKTYFMNLSDLLNRILKKNDFIKLLSIHLFNIKKIILNNSTYQDYIYKIAYHENRINDDVLNISIDKKNYKVLMELLEHKEFSSLKTSYEKEYYFKDKKMKIKLSI